MTIDLRASLVIASAAASLVLLLVTASGAPAAQPGRSLYVDPAGSDSNSGTSPANAWRTIAKVNSTTLLPGDVVYLKRGGVWRETLDPHNGGAAGRPVSFTAYGSGENPVISGSDVVTGWTLTGGRVYRAHSARPNNVYVDGGPGWGITRACCLPSAACTPIGTCAAGPMVPGSWYWDAQTSQLYLWLIDGSNPAGHTVEAAVRVYGMKVIADAGEKGNMVADGLTFERTGGYGIYFYSNGERGVGPTGVVIRNNVVTQTGTGRVDGGEYYNAIHFSEHIPLDTAPMYIDNTISYSGGHGNAINSQSANGAQLIGNHAEHFNHHGFDIKQSASVVVRGNVAHDAPETNGIYQEYCANGLIEQNVVYNLTGSVPGRGSGIQIDVGSSGARILNNSVYNVLTGIYLNNPATARYNAVTTTGHAVLEANAGGVFDHNVWGTAPVFYVDGKRYDFSAWMAMGTHLGDMAADPMWVDAAHGEFSLLPGSPCTVMNAGAILKAPGRAQIRSKELGGEETAGGVLMR